MPPGLDLCQFFVKNSLCNFFSYRRLFWIKSAKFRKISQNSTKGTIMNNETALRLKTLEDRIAQMLRYL